MHLILKASLSRFHFLLIALQIVANEKGQKFTRYYAIRIFLARYWIFRRFFPALSVIKREEAKTHLKWTGASKAR